MGGRAGSRLSEASRSSQRNSGEGELKKRTLTNLYNARPQWLADAHATLDSAVADTYGWRADITDDDVRCELLELNLYRLERGTRARNT